MFGHCVVRPELSGVRGIDSVEVELERQRVVVTGEALDDGAIRAAIYEAGSDALA